MFIRDRAAATPQGVTPEGFLRLRARIGRTGLHEYRAEELGLPEGFGPGDRIRVWRPPDAVFDPVSMASFAAKPVTDDHPPTMVDASNWRRYAIGHSGDKVAAEGDHLAADLFIADADAASRVREGTELSNGYHADFVFEPGTTPDGEPYDAVQRNIRGNHIALVDAGRCGASCRVGAATTDAATGLSPIARTAEPPKAADAACGCHGEGADAAPDVATLDALVMERTAVLDAARRLIGPGFDTGGRGTPDIRRLVVRWRLGETAVAGRSDAYVAAAFDTLAALQGRANPLATHLSAGRAPAGPEAALAARDLFLTRAWHGEGTHGDL